MSLLHLISGVTFDYADPFACEAITAHDVAHALARISRYGGHCAGTWSVAQHTLLVAELVVGWYHEPRLGRGALNHDDAEFVTGDWPTPLKDHLRAEGFDFAKLERPIEMAVANHLGLVVDDLHAGVVKDADDAAYEVEIRALKPNGYESREEPDEDLLEYGTRAMMVLGSLETPEVERLWLAVDHAMGEQS